MRLLKLAFLLSICRREVRAISYRLDNFPDEWINHLSGRPGLTHIVHNSQQFSIYLEGNNGGFLAIDGTPVYTFRWAERKLMEWVIGHHTKSFMTLGYSVTGAVELTAALEGVAA